MAQRHPDPEAPHDVLAADEFAMPAADPDLHHHGPILLPDDPTGISEPHDVLAAEEFPMPAPLARPVSALAERRGGFGRLVVEIAAVLLVLALVARVRRPR